MIRAACAKHGRLIPARAGKTHCRSPRSAACPAHPRAGGENDQGAPDHGWPVGSSPRGRGKRRRLVEAISHGGLIPARAGKTGECVEAVGGIGAHPRAGGENHIR